MNVDTRPIGSVVVVDGVPLMVVPGDACDGCYFETVSSDNTQICGNLSTTLGGCSAVNRSDNRNVVFKVVDDYRDMLITV